MNHEPTAKSSLTKFSLSAAFQYWLYQVQESQDIRFWPRYVHVAVWAVLAPQGRGINMILKSLNY